jgi:hypothetical protein
MGGEGGSINVDEDVDVHIIPVFPANKQPLG